MYPKAIQQLIDAFTRLPSVGPRTASRFVFHMLKADEKEVQELLEALTRLKQQIQLCSFCFNPFDTAESKEDLCNLCLDTTRDQTLLCVIEKESDLESIERTHQYHGRYFILGGTVGMLRQEDLKRLRTKELKEKAPSFKEVILATNPTTDGEATALYLERILHPMNIQTTRLGRGIPIGGEIEYADEETIRSALEGRR